MYVVLFSHRNIALLLHVIYMIRREIHAGVGGLSCSSEYAQASYLSIRRVRDPGGLSGFFACKHGACM